ncbi:hypothetical protein LAZ40_07015 [Cereibacter sphaeroides]|uniref:hypothetical protein n=1 Tax=Cereibacter sphaeroides TaxID=1063 RepID=UPI001F2C14E7|nr:hypothetical protein [Cereibacter sphaeroides]MCE6958798.1 hypothetical protein [Cereibacter sphaeroides]MCE6973328.1 hypothetical protein [Cereibacter sphaeroides]
MGSGRWDANDWASYASTNTTGKTTSQIFQATRIDDQFDPAKIARRESRNSADNPRATPVIIASDVTGSMGMIATKLMQDGLNVLVKEIYDRKPVSDPHILVAAVGDAWSDRAPLQVTQFEADIRLADQVRSLWVEGNGGGNDGESYAAAHLFAALKTETDAAAEGRKGFLFTVGDEPNHDGMTAAQIERVLGVKVERDLSAADCVAMAERHWHVFHIALVNEGYCQHGRREVLENWRRILPERTIALEDVNALAETVVSLMQVTAGARAADVAASWSGSTSLVVANALKGVPAVAANRGLRRLSA